jgi:TFIIF-interacting CTD phosphatase-like protein
MPSQGLDPLTGTESYPSDQTENQIIIRRKAVDKKAPERYIPCIDKIKTELQVSIRTSLQDAVWKSVAKI